MIEYYLTRPLYYWLGFTLCSSFSHIMHWRPNKAPVTPLQFHIDQKTSHLLNSTFVYFFQFIIMYYKGKINYCFVHKKANQRNAHWNLLVLNNIFVMLSYVCLMFWGILCRTNFWSVINKVSLSTIKNEFLQRMLTDNDEGWMLTFASSSFR